MHAAKSYRLAFEESIVHPKASILHSSKNLFGVDASQTSVSFVTAGNWRFAWLVISNFKRLQIQSKKVVSMKPFVAFSILILASLAATIDCRAATPLPVKVEFNRDVRPILSDNCFFCHGPDKNHRKGKLRLDIREDALAKEAFVPGKPEASELIKRLSSADKEEVMPPPDSHKTLSARDKDILKLWIQQGAAYQLHWSYEKPVKAEVAAKQNGIDVLVRKRLAEIGLKPSPEADRHTLVRRLYSDLLGLPPTPEEALAFEKDTSPDAYEKLVDRLLANPHYGERMAIGWLDVVRFADTIGYHSDNPRNISPYRDYVIKSFNDNKRFDRFTLEQVAGDMLKDANQETRVGSAFNRLLLSTEEGGAQSKDYEARMLTDRVRAVGAAWLGQTTGCCQCHDHKFDPLTQRDFYSLGAFFADIKESILGRREDGMLVPDEKQTIEIARLDADLNRLQKEFDAPQTERAAGFSTWQNEALEAAKRDALWKTLSPAAVASKSKAKLTLQKDNSVLVSGTNPATDTYTIAITDILNGITSLRVEALPDPSLPASGPGRGANGNFVLSEVVAKVSRVDNPAEQIFFAHAHASFEQTSGAENRMYKTWAASETIDGDSKSANNGWAIMPEVGKAQHLVLQLAEPLTLAIGDTLNIELEHNSGENKNHTLGRFRLAATTDAAAAAVAPLPAPPEDILAILKTAADKRNQAQKDKLFAHYKNVSPDLADLRKKLDAAKKSKTDFEATVQKCLVSISTGKRKVRILARGNFMDESGEVVTAALPHFLPQPKFEGREPTRLDLAEWLVSRENPLTARTVINRMWKQFFGMGLSKVLDDLGAQGEQPLNPALLDYLACEFMDSGWDVKHMVRLIVTSQTYKQVSTASKELVGSDPYNRELARQSRFRIDAELVRDNALSVSGLLVPTIGGPSVKPYQPEKYWDNLNFPQREYQNDSGDNQYRRGLYTWWQRSFLHPSLVAFDAPSREECCAERNRSNIPQQALVLLNDPTYVEAARSLAAGVLKDGGGSNDQRIKWAWQRVLQRDPSADELKIMTDLLTQHLADYNKDPKAAEALLKTGIAPLAGVGE